MWAAKPLQKLIPIKTGRSLVGISDMGFGDALLPSCPASAPSTVCNSLIPELNVFTSLLNILSLLEKLNNEVVSLS